MWYRIENKVSRIHLSDQLISTNPDLTTDLCAEILISHSGLNYWDLLSLFRGNNCVKLKKILKEFEQDENPKFIKNLDEHVIGGIQQKGGRKNVTDTYFILDNNALFVTKKSENDNERFNIVKDEVLIGEYLYPKLSEFVNKNDIPGFEALFIASIESVFKKFKINDNNAIIKTEAIDCITKNTIITKEGFDFFDIEYSPNIVLTKSHFLFRSALGFQKHYINRQYWPYRAPNDLYLVFCNYFLIKHDVENDINSEIKFLTPILESESKSLSKKELAMGFYNTTPFVIKLFRWLKNKLD